MKTGERFAGFELVHLLFLVSAGELAFNRLAYNELSSTGASALAKTPPWWEVGLYHVGLFCQYFACILAVSIIGYRLLELVRRREMYWSGVRIGMAITGGLLGVFALASVLGLLGAGAQVVLSTCFIGFVMCLTVGQLARAGDTWIKLGILLVATPFAVHYYGLISAQFMEPMEYTLSPLPDQVARYAQWTIIAAALLSPYCFAPQPLLTSLARPIPWVLALLTGVVSMIILRDYFEVARNLAHNWMGIDLGAGVPRVTLFTYALAIGTATWTFAACVSAESAARRDLGIGIGLIVIWPLHFLIGAIGLMLISEAAFRVAQEEKDETRPLMRPRTPPIDKQVWYAYVNQLKHIIENTNIGGSPQRTASTVTMVDNEGRACTYIVTRIRYIDVFVRIERAYDAVASIEVICGHEPEPGIEPDWTLYARSPRLGASGRHPRPPKTSSPVRHFPEDESLDRRFRVHDPGTLTERLLDDQGRHIAVALFDGWIAYWRNCGLHYRVFPGLGAPLDYPLPITKLAHGTHTDDVAKPMFALIDALSRMMYLSQPTAADIAADALAADTSADAPAADAPAADTSADAPAADAPAADAPY